MQLSIKIWVKLLNDSTNIGTWTLPLINSLKFMLQLKCTLSMHFQRKMWVYAVKAKCWRRTEVHWGRAWHSNNSLIAVMKSAALWPTQYLQLPKFNFEPQNILFDTKKEIQKTRDFDPTVFQNTAAHGSRLTLVMETSGKTKYSTRVMGASPELSQRNCLDFYSN